MADVLNARDAHQIASNFDQLTDTIARIRKAAEAGRYEIRVDLPSQDVIDTLKTLGYQVKGVDNEFRTCRVSWILQK